MTKRWICLKTILVAILGTTLVSCGGGIQSGTLAANFTGVSAGTPLSPTSVRLAWTKNDSVSEYEIYEARSSEALKRTVFDSVVIEDLQPDTEYIFKVVGISGPTRFGIEKEVRVRTWERFRGVSEVISDSADSLIVSWNYAHEPMRFHIFVGAGVIPTAANTDNWTKSGSPNIQMLKSNGKSYHVGNLKASTEYHVAVQVQYRDDEFDVNAKTLSVISGTTFRAPDYVLPRISIGSLPYISVSPFSSPQHQVSLFRSQAFWNSTPVSDPLMGAGQVVFNASAALPIGKVENISLKVDYTAPGSEESLTIRGLSTYIKGMANHFETPPVEVLNQGASYFGKALASGDFNCDGGDDLAIGVPDISLAQFGVKTTQAGAVFIFYSEKVGDRYRLNITGTPQVIPPQPGHSPQVLTFDDLGSHHFGTSLAAGNLNGDRLGLNKCDDLLVGAPGESGNGNAFIFFGGQQGLKAPLRVQDMPVNTESCDGLIEGANCTAVRLTPDMGLIPQALLGGSPFRSITSIHSRFGEATSFIGDFNADGFDDIAIGAPTSYFWGHVSNFPGYVRSGMVAIYFGSQFGLGKENVNGFDLRFLPVMPPIPEQDMRFGASIHGGADVDGGYKRLLNKPSSPFHNKLVGGSDLIIGAPGFTYSNYTLGPLRNKVSNSPESHVIPPSSGWLAPGDLLSNATNFYGIRHGVNRTGAAFLYFGYSSTSVSGVDAVSRDQFWNCGNRGFSSPGEHFSCLASTGSYRILSPREGNTVGFGSAVALIGDPSRYRSLTNDPIEINNDPLLPYQYYSDSNGDGYADIVISAPSTAVSGKSQVGTLWQFFGNPRNVNLYEVGDLYNVKSPNAPLATDDYTINFPSCDGFTSAAKRSQCAPSLLRSNSMASGTTLGATEAQFAVGDITGDGLKDLVVGAPGETTIGAGSGAVLVYTSLKNAGLTSAYKKFYGTETSANDGLGTAVTTGNFNGDFNIFAGNPAYPTINPMYDVFAGAPFDGFGAPAVGAVLGFVSSGLPLPSTMSSTSNGFGSPLSLRETQASFQEYGLGAARIVGDLNGDGYEDAITRETFYHADGSRQTDVIVYYGSELGLITVQFCLNNKDKIFLAENAPNSDCYPSVVPNRGLTKNDMSLPQKISRPLNLPTDWFQIAFRAGDINNDGFADVLLVGQPAGGTDSFVVYYGARGGLQNVVDPSYTPSVGDPQIVMQKSALRATSHYDSHLETERFVSGDFNGDGFSDLAIGMPFMPSPPMNTPSAPYLPRSGSGVSSGQGWLCPVGTQDPSCEAGDRLLEHGMMVIVYGSGQGLQTPALKGFTIGSFNFGDPGTLDMLNTEDAGAPTKPCTEAQPGQAANCSLTYLYNPVFENIMNGYVVLEGMNFGYSMAPIEANIDAFDDLIVGTPGFEDIACHDQTTTPRNYGRNFVFYGSSRGLVASIREDYYNFETNSAAVGCPVAPENDPSSGLMASGGKIRSLQPSLSNQALNLENKGLGTRIATVGDVNNDGFEDFMMLVPSENLPDGAGGSTRPGMAYLYYGPLCPLDNEPNINEWFQSDAAGTTYDNHINVQTYAAGTAPPDTPPSLTYMGSLPAAVTASCVRSSTLGIKPLPLKFQVMGAGTSDQYGRGFTQFRAGNGDFDGDGYDDVMLGSDLITDLGRNIPNLGQGVVFFGSRLGLSVEDYPTVALSLNGKDQNRPFLVIPKSSESGSAFFKGNISVGDVNHDRTADYMVTSQKSVGTGSTKGIQIGTFFLFY